MAQDILSERLADGVQVHEVDLMKGGDVVKRGAEFGHSRRRDRFFSGDGDIQIGMRRAVPFGQDPNQLTSISAPRIRLAAARLLEPFVEVGSWILDRAWAQCNGFGDDVNQGPTSPAS